MKISQLFQGARYIGQAKGDRKTYHVFRSSNAYLVVAPSSTKGYYLNVVGRNAPDFVSRRFKGGLLTAPKLKQRARRPDLFAAPFQPLQTLYVLVALGRARKLQRHEGRALVFKIG